MTHLLNIIFLIASVSLNNVDSGSIMKPNIASPEVNLLESNMKNCSVQTFDECDNFSNETAKKYPEIYYRCSAYFYIATKLCKYEKKEKINLELVTEMNTTVLCQELKNFTTTNKTEFTDAVLSFTKSCLIICPDITKDNNTPRNICQFILSGYKFLSNNNSTSNLPIPSRKQEPNISLQSKTSTDIKSSQQSAKHSDDIGHNSADKEEKDKKVSQTKHEDSSILPKSTTTTHPDEPPKSASNIGSPINNAQTSQSATVSKDVKEDIELKSKDANAHNIIAEDSTTREDDSQATNNEAKDTESTILRDDPDEADEGFSEQSKDDQDADSNPTTIINLRQSESSMPDANLDFVQAEDSHFFLYFLGAMAVCILAYVGFHNKQKILALVLEGRRSRGGRNGRRRHTAVYRKLDSNLEEAITSCGNSNVTQVIY